MDKETTQDAGAELSEQITERFEKLRADVEETESRARELVRRYPVGALAAALVGGYVVARIVNRL
jgi:hypothetical protein